VTGTGDTDPVLAAQLRYYRERAAEYDATSYGDERAFVGPVARTIEPLGDVLELACGTGVWTRELAPRAASYLAVDAAPEMLAFAAANLDGPDSTAVELRCADVFDLGLGREFDTVFFAAWISHVPPDRFAEFWASVASVLRPGGRAVFLDELPERARNETELAGSMATRTLADGSRHRIVKVFYDPDDLVARLRELGWETTVTRTPNDWFVATARPAQRQG
jgi:demethylmenaquinone methyltransferase/2-methoxy-6-polyprenyl-1,4-benzoquinol methylase